MWGIISALDKILDGNPIRIKESVFENEKYLEDVLAKDISILNTEWMIIGRQVLTANNKYIDILAIDRNGYLIVIELKKDKTPRDVVAQAIDYASWVKELKAEQINSIYHNSNTYNSNNVDTLANAYKNKFGIELTDDSINQSHQIVIVASSLDPSTERIVKYLSDSEVPINVIFFTVFEDANIRFLSRAWLIEPNETEENALTRGTNLLWNGEYYCSFGDDEDRSWEDARKYGFISGGGGSWYSQTLFKLEPGNRVWVNIPGQGYVGVCHVKQRAMKMCDVTFRGDYENKSIREVKSIGKYGLDDVSDEKAEYCVLVDWIKTVGENEAVRELGFFGSQHTVCRPTASKWRFTIDRLKEKWNVQ